MDRELGWRAVLLLYGREDAERRVQLIGKRGAIIKPEERGSCEMYRIDDVKSSPEVDFRGQLRVGLLLRTAILQC